MSDNYVIKEVNKEAFVIIECECGSHMLKITSDADIYTNKDNSQRVRQSFYLAMFSYGYEKRGFFGALRIAFNYLRTRKMFSDQLCLAPSEAKKMIEFINANIIETQ